MRPFLVLIVSLFVGVAVGAASTIPQWSATNDFGSVTHPEVKRVQSSNDPMPKAVVVGAEVFEFGKMNVDATLTTIIDDIKSVNETFVCKDLCNASVQLVVETRNNRRVISHCISYASEHVGC